MRRGSFGAAIRLVHPFPSMLNAAVVAVVAFVAGAEPGRIAVLATSMLALQFSIGAANDWADAPADAESRPAKPIPAGLVDRADAGRIAALAAAIGMGLAASVGLATAAVGAVGLGAGLAYDLRLKGTRWSWVPYTVGIPLLPVFAWVGATGSLTAGIALIIPLAILAGAALAIANALADVDEDRRAGVETVATALGVDIARRVGAVLMTSAVGAAVVSAIALGGTSPWTAVLVVGSALAVGGIGVGWLARAGSSQHAWELQAIGTAVVAAGWIGAVAGAGVAAG